MKSVGITRLVFCKFRDVCKRRHEDYMCGPPSDCKTEGSLKRHPKVCRNFTHNKSFRHNEICAYIKDQEEVDIWIPTWNFSSYAIN